MYPAIAIAAFLALANFPVHGQADLGVVKPRKTFSVCTGVENPVTFYGSATNDVPILPHVLEQLGYKWNGSDYVAPRGRSVPLASGILTMPKHGTMKLSDEKHHLYWYEAEPGYLGRDFAVLWIRVGNQSYKLRLRLDVVRNLDFDPHCGWIPGRG